ncbi:TetR/AcrR family transcriptional regulator [Sulfitobacter sp. D35]|uniref:TetR/AcrR family transcriptional regulator n=1 Tax=Sulfitobacter sp. D35 TaxID=3083252 RepID=UPI00296F2F62|nr:TetR/AcrR family transcriptional regulator [Sulfitobacter sp. D35]MDW4496453.1 TetR/AcrR family transcriptional regulator [Sulfitobacter sp. D35]
MARQIAKDHDQKRARILKTAARVFAEEGFARASMAQVAKACEISKANIYHYYGSKDALLFDILDSYLCALHDRVLGLQLDGLEPSERLRRAIAETLLAYEGMDHEHQIQTEGIALLPPDQQEVLKGYQRDMVRFFGAILGDVAPESFAGDPGKLRAATMSVFGMLNWFYMWNGGADREARLGYADLVSQLTLNGVRAL